MTVLEAVQQALGPWPEAEQRGDAVSFATHCLYPSNAFVRVYVAGGRNEFKVTDGRGAFDELEASGGRAREDIYVLRSIAKPQGLFVSDAGVIHSPIVAQEQLLGAILLVANVSKEAANALVSKFRAVPKRNFREMLASILDSEMAQGRLLDISSQRPVTGASKKSHKFDYDIVLRGNRRVLIDTVVPEASSINSVLAANIDIKGAEIAGLEQRIVYDDEDQWRATDLNLLALGAIVVPFSRMRPALQKLAA